MKSGSLTNSVGSFSLLTNTSPITQSLNPFKGVFARTGACGKSSLKREPVLSTVEGGPVGFRRCFRPKVEAPLKLSENLKSLMYVCCLMLWVTSLSAQKGNLTGKVLDEKGAFLPYATVLVYQGEQFVNGARTDEKGEFMIKPLLAGRYRVVVKYLTSERVITDVHIRENETRILDVMVEVSDSHPSEVVIVTVTFGVLEKDPVPSGATYNNLDKNLWHPAYIPRDQK